MKQELKTAIILATALLFLSSSCDYIDNNKQTKPNIVFIIADDLSWEHVGAYGYKNVNTPHIDKLAQEGVLFTNTFVSTSSCTASRASILTGRNGFAENVQFKEDTLSFQALSIITRVNISKHDNT